MAMRDYQQSVTNGQTDSQRHGQTDAGQSDPYVLLCFTGDTIWLADWDIFVTVASAVSKDME